MLNILLENANCARKHRKKLCAV